MMMLLYFVAEHWRDAVLLDHQFYLHWCQVWWVSMWNNEWMKGCEDDDDTLFCCRALAICCAPCSPIALEPMFSVVSVYVK
jgi:hypothetical protein